MKTLLTIGIVGFFAQLVDGSLGMGYGATSASLLLATGLTPAAASASVHLAEIGTNAASALSHWRLKNIDPKLVLRLGVPGAVGAFLGATILSKLSTEAAAPIMAGILLTLGVYILVRFAVRPPATSTARVSPHRPRFLAPLGLICGFVNATGGGGWGPVTTTTLLSAGKTAPRTIVGSVDTSEFLVSVSASLAFLIGLGTSGINFQFAGVLLLGGLLAAPLAAYAVSRIPARVLGSAVGGLIIITSLRSLFKEISVSGPAVPWAYLAVVIVWLAAVAVAIVRHRQHEAERAADASSAPLEPAESLG